jgi:hypothetical protein
MAEDRPTATTPLRRLAPFAAAGCAALLAAAVRARARARGRLAGGAGDPPERGYAEERMEENASGEGMPERDGG